MNGPIFTSGFLVVLDHRAVHLFIFHSVKNLVTICLIPLTGANYVGTNDVALSEVRTEKPLPQNGGGEVDGEEPPPAQDDDRPRVEKSVLQGKLTKLAIQIGYGGRFTRTTIDGWTSDGPIS